MSGRLAIQELTPEDIRAEIGAATTDGLDATRIADFLYSVDWSGTADTPDDDPVIVLLGTLMGWETEYAEGDITADEYLDQLRSVITSRV